MLKFKKPISILLLASYTLSQVVGAHAVEQRFWAERRLAESRLKSGSFSGPANPFPSLVKTLETGMTPHTQGPLSLVLPFGTVHSTHHSHRKEAPTVLLVQDAHGVVEAQWNQSRMIEALAAQNRHLLVGLEGAEGSFDLTPHRSFPHPEVSRAIAGHLLETGYLGGAEMAAIQNPQPLFLWGVENENLYLKNVQTVRDAKAQQQLLTRWRADARRRWRTARDRWYSPELKQLDKVLQEYRNGDRPLGEFVESLWAVLPISERRKFPQAGKFLEILEVERNLNFDRAEKERRDFMEQLAQIVSKVDLDTLAKEALEQRLGQKSILDFYNNLQNLCRRYGVSIRRWAAFQQYLAYLEGVGSLNREAMIKELEKLETTAPFALADSPEQREVLTVDQNLRLLEKLGRHEMTPTDWATYGSGEKIESMEKSLASLGLPSSTPRPDVTPYEDFCRIALQRNSVLVGNLLAKMEATKSNWGVLVAGGFHTEGMAALLRQKQVSYAVVSPHITEIPEENHTLDVFTRSPLPLEKMFSGEKIFLNSWRLTAERTPPEAAYRKGYLNGLFASLLQMAQRLSFPEEKSFPTFPGVQGLKLASSPSQGKALGDYRFDLGSGQGMEWTVYPLGKAPQNTKAVRLLGYDLVLKSLSPQFGMKIFWQRGLWAPLVESLVTLPLVALKMMGLKSLFQKERDRYLQSHGPMNSLQRLRRETGVDWMVLGAGMGAVLGFALGWTGAVPLESAGAWAAALLGGLTLGQAAAHATHNLLDLAFDGKSPLTLSKNKATVGVFRSNPSELKVVALGALLTQDKDSFIAEATHLSTISSNFQDFINTIEANPESSSILKITAQILPKLISEKTINPLPLMASYFTGLVKESKEGVYWTYACLDPDGRVVGYLVSDPSDEQTIQITHLNVLDQGRGREIVHRLLWALVREASRHEHEILELEMKEGRVFPEEVLQWFPPQKPGEIKFPQISIQEVYPPEEDLIRSSLQTIDGPREWEGVFKDILPYLKEISSNTKKAGVVAHLFKARFRADENFDLKQEKTEIQVLLNHKKINFSDKEIENIAQTLLRMRRGREALIHQAAKILRQRSDAFVEFEKQASPLQVRLFFDLVRETTVSGILGKEEHLYDLGEMDPWARVREEEFRNVIHPWQGHPAEFSDPLKSLALEALRDAMSFPMFLPRPKASPMDRKFVELIGESRVLHNLVGKFPDNTTEHFVFPKPKVKGLVLDLAGGRFDQFVQNLDKNRKHVAVDFSPFVKAYFDGLARELGMQNTLEVLTENISKMDFGRLGPLALVHVNNLFSYVREYRKEEAWIHLAEAIAPGGQLLIHSEPNGLFRRNLVSVLGKTPKTLLQQGWRFTYRISQGTEMDWISFERPDSPSAPPGGEAAWETFIQELEVNNSERESFRLFGDFFDGGLTLPFLRRVESRLDRWGVPGAQKGVRGFLAPVLESFVTLPLALLTGFGANRSAKTLRQWYVKAHGPRSLAERRSLLTGIALIQRATGMGGGMGLITGMVLFPGLPWMEGFLALAFYGKMAVVGAVLGNIIAHAMHNLQKDSRKSLSRLRSTKILSQRVFRAPLVESVVTLPLVALKLMGLNSLFRKERDRYLEHHGPMNSLQRLRRETGVDWMVLGAGMGAVLGLALGWTGAVPLESAGAWAAALLGGLTLGQAAAHATHNLLDLRFQWGAPLTLPSLKEGEAQIQSLRGLLVPDLEATVDYVKAHANRDEETDQKIFLQGGTGVPRILHLIAQMVDQQNRFHTQTGILPSTNPFEILHLAFIENDHDLFLSQVALSHDGKVLGFLLATPQENDTVRIGVLVVDPKVQGKGIGTGLIRRLAVSALSQGFKTVDLLVNKNNTAAKNYYRGLGFDPHFPPGKTEDSLMNNPEGNAFRYKVPIVSLLRRTLAGYRGGGRGPPAAFDRVNSISDTQKFQADSEKSWLDRATEVLHRQSAAYRGLENAPAFDRKRFFQTLAGVVAGTLGHIDFSAPEDGDWDRINMAALIGSKKYMDPESPSQKLTEEYLTTLDNLHEAVMDALSAPFFIPAGEGQDTSFVEALAELHGGWYLASSAAHSLAPIQEFFKKMPPANIDRSPFIRSLLRMLAREKEMDPVVLQEALLSEKKKVPGGSSVPPGEQNPRISPSGADSLRVISLAALFNQDKMPFLQHFEFLQKSNLSVGEVLAYFLNDSSVPPILKVAAQILVQVHVPGKDILELFLNFFTGLTKEASNKQYWSQVCLNADGDMVGYLLADRGPTGVVQVLQFDLVQGKWNRSEVARRLLTALAEETQRHKGTSLELVLENSFPAEVLALFHAADGGPQGKNPRVPVEEFLPAAAPRAPLKAVETDRPWEGVFLEILPVLRKAKNNPIKMGVLSELITVLSQIERAEVPKTVNQTYKDYSLPMDRREIETLVETIENIRNARKALVGQASGLLRQRSAAFQQLESQVSPLFLALFFDVVVSTARTGIIRVETGYHRLGTGGPLGLMAEKEIDDLMDVVEDINMEQKRVLRPLCHRALMDAMRFPFFSPEEQAEPLEEKFVDLIAELSVMSKWAETFAENKTDPTSFLNPKGPGALVDLASGFRFAQFIPNLKKGQRAVAVDLSPFVKTYLKGLAREGGLQNELEVLNVDLSTYDLSSLKPIAVIRAHNLQSYVPEYLKPEAWKKLADNLVPGGRLILQSEPSNQHRISLWTALGKLIPEWLAQGWRIDYRISSGEEPDWFILHRPTEKNPPSQPPAVLAGLVKELKDQMESRNELPGLVKSLFEGDLKLPLLEKMEKESRSTPAIEEPLDPAVQVYSLGYLARRDNAQLLHYLEGVHVKNNSVLYAILKGGSEAPPFLKVVGEIVEQSYKANNRAPIDLFDFLAALIQEARTEEDFSQVALGPDGRLAGYVLATKKDASRVAVEQLFVRENPVSVGRAKKMLDALLDEAERLEKKTLILGPDPLEQPDVRTIFDLEGKGNAGQVQEMSMDRLRAIVRPPKKPLIPIPLDRSWEGAFREILPLLRRYENDVEKCRDLVAFLNEMMMSQNKGAAVQGAAGRLGFLSEREAQTVLRAGHRLMAARTLLVRQAAEILSQRSPAFREIQKKRDPLFVGLFFKAVQLVAEKAIINVLRKSSREVREETRDRIIKETVTELGVYFSHRFDRNSEEWKQLISLSTQALRDVLDFPFQEVQGSFDPMERLFVELIGELRAFENLVADFSDNADAGYLLPGPKVPGVVVDMAGGRFDRYIQNLKKGQRYIALDISPFVKESFDGMARELGLREELTTLNVDLSTYDLKELSPIALIRVNNIYPYVSEYRTMAQWGKIFEALAPGGELLIHCEPMADYRESLLAVLGKQPTVLLSQGWTFDFTLSQDNTLDRLSFYKPLEGAHSTAPTDLWEKCVQELEAEIQKERASLRSEGKASPLTLPFLRRLENQMDRWGIKGAQRIVRGFLAPVLESFLTLPLALFTGLGPDRSAKSLRHGYVKAHGPRSLAEQRSLLRGIRQMNRATVWGAVVGLLTGMVLFPGLPWVDGFMASIFYGKTTAVGAWLGNVLSHSIHNLRGFRRFGNSQEFSPERRDLVDLILKNLEPLRPADFETWVLRHGVSLGTVPDFVRRARQNPLTWMEGKQAGTALSAEEARAFLGYRLGQGRAAQWETGQAAVINLTGFSSWGKTEKAMVLGFLERLAHESSEIGPDRVVLLDSTPQGESSRGLRVDPALAILMNDRNRLRVRLGDSVQKRPDSGAVDLKATLQRGAVSGENLEKYALVLLTARESDVFWENLTVIPVYLGALSQSIESHWKALLATLVSA